MGRLRRKREQIQKLIQQYENEATAWESAKKMTLDKLAHLTTTSEENSSEDDTQLENGQFEAAEVTETTRNMLQHAKNISLQADCVERAVIAVDIFASDYKRGHTELVDAFQAQTKGTYGDV